MSDTPKLKAAVVVPAYQAAETIAACLDGLLAQQTRRVQLEIIVVDDGSTDATPRIVGNYRSRGVRLVRQANAGAAAARNTGVRATRPEYSLILFTDADCVPAPDWAERLATGLAASPPMVAGLKGSYKTNQTSSVARFVQTEFEERYDRFRRDRVQPDFCDTYSAAYRREILLQNPFDESLPGAVVEDAELGWRLRQLGYEFVFEPGAVVYHSHPATAGTYFRRKFRIGRWRVDLYRHYPGQLGSDTHTSQAAKLEMLLMALCLGLTVSLVWQPWRKVGAVSVFVSLLSLEISYFKFARHVRHHDPRLGGTTWLMLHLRTLAFLSGAAWGVARQLFRQAGYTSYEAAQNEVPKTRLKIG